LKVLFPFVGDSVGGSHNSIIELYQSLKKTSICPIIVVHNKGVLTDYLENLEIPYILFSANKLAGESANILKIIYGIMLNFSNFQRFLKKNKIDIVHGNDLRINLTWSLPARLSKAKYIWHQRTTMSSSFLWKFSFLQFDHIVAISEHVYKSLPNNIPSFKKSFVLNPFDVEKIYVKSTSRKWVEDKYGIPKDIILFGYIGRLISWKNVDQLIQYFSKFIKNRKDLIYLLIIGTGSDEYMEKLKKISIECGVENQVIFGGFTTEPSKVIASFDLLISSSNNEPFGRTIVEAMVQKTSVLGAYGGGHNETIIPGKTGYLYNHESLKDFCKKCDMNIQNKEDREKMIKNAHQLVCNKYSSKNHLEAMLNIYKRVSEITNEKK